VSVHVLEVADTTYLDELLIGADGLIRPVPAESLESVPVGHYMQWCVKHGVYQIPTTELILWLNAKIGVKTCIEICAGKSGIGYQLGVKTTDSYMHAIPDIREWYLANGLTPTDPPAYVEKIDANAAVKKYDPHVVLGCWVTQKWQPSDNEGSTYGSVEEDWLDAGKTYIHVGSLSVHRSKRILRRAHEVYQFPWLFSRSGRTSNRIWVWEP